ncbi:TonB-dependent receptor domain-containing protein [Duganella sp. BuS-21]|uniref:TonB-dependent receptor domain-containing protein n=1 Tax=Duganella sp. BuS-21 TaxID=2943848 RepID=UPI0035A725EF
MLKGPQSTLFGKSSIAGAINITTKPIGGPWKTNATTYVTNDDEWRVGVSTGGSVSDTLRLRVAASKTNVDGTLNNLTTGKKLNGSKGDNISGKLEWQPLDQLPLTLTPHYNRTEKFCCSTAFTSMSPGALYRNARQLPPSVVLAGTGVKLDWAFDEAGALAGHTLSSISSYSKYHMNDYQDNDNTDVNILPFLLLPNGQPTGMQGGLEHSLNKDAMFYAMAYSGHKGKAYDLTSGFTSATAKLPAVAPETARSYELGWKQSLWDNRAMFSVALFRTNFKHFQQSSSFFDDDGTFRTGLNSIGGLRTQGLEAEGNVRVTRELQLNGSFAYTKPGRQDLAERAESESEPRRPVRPDVAVSQLQRLRGRLHALPEPHVVLAEPGSKHHPGRLSHHQPQLRREGQAGPLQGDLPGQQPVRQALRDRPQQRHCQRQLESESAEHADRGQHHGMDAAARLPTLLRRPPGHDVLKCISLATLLHGRTSALRALPRGGLFFE